MPSSFVPIALALALFVTAAPSASAESLLFVRGGDVWLTVPDGSREHRVTATGGFATATQSDDGTIVAVREGALHRLDSRGAALSTPFEIMAYAAYGVRQRATPLDPQLSPDGTKVAYWVATTCTAWGGGMESCTRVQVTDAATATDPLEPYGTYTGRYPTWFGNDRLVYSNGGWQIHTMPLGGIGDSWFTWDQTKTRAVAVTSAGHRLAVVGAPEAGGPAIIRLYTTDGAPPAEPAAGCELPGGDDEPSDLTWSPDGSGLAWQQNDGVHVAAGFDPTTCATSSIRTIPGASSPDWGRADVPAPEPAAATDVGTGTGTSTGTAPGQPATPLAAVLTATTITRGQTLRSVVRKGLRLSVTCGAPCKVTGTARLSRKIVAKGSRTLSGGIARLVLEVGKRARRTLLAKRRAKLSVKLVATSAGNPTATRTLSVTLRR